MRFIHTGDVHLGYVPPKSGTWSDTRADEIWGTFERLIRNIKKILWICLLFREIYLTGSHFCERLRRLTICFLPSRIQR